MKKEILYHGSAYIVKNPEYGKGKPYNDYGRGFYCTKHLELAKEWAVGEGIDGYVNEYEIDLSKLKILDLREKPYNILHWMAILLRNREFNVKSPVATRGKQYLLDNYLIDTSIYDLVIGYRADDSYFSFARDFLNNTISVEQLSYAMKLGELKEQYVLISQKAFDMIHFVSFEIADSSEYYPKRLDRDLKARDAYLSQTNDTGIDGIFIRDIVNGVAFNE